MKELPKTNGEKTKLSLKCLVKKPWKLTSSFEWQIAETQLKTNRKTDRTDKLPFWIQNATMKNTWLRRCRGDALMQSVLDKIGEVIRHFGDLHRRSRKGEKKKSVEEKWSVLVILIKIYRSNVEMEREWKWKEEAKKNYKYGKHMEKFVNEIQGHFQKGKINNREMVFLKTLVWRLRRIEKNVGI